MAESTGSGDSIGYRSSGGLLWFFVWKGLFAVLHTRELIMDTGLSTVNARPPLIPPCFIQQRFIGNLINGHRIDIYIYTYICCRLCTVRPLTVHFPHFHYWWDVARKPFSSLLKVIEFIVRTDEDARFGSLTGGFWWEIWMELS